MAIVGAENLAGEDVGIQCLAGGRDITREIVGTLDVSPPQYVHAQQVAPPGQMQGGWGQHRQLPQQGGQGGWPGQGQGGGQGGWGQG